MKYSSIILSFILLAACTDDKKGPGFDANTNMRGVFTAQSETKNQLSAQMCPTNSANDLDSRLAAGMVFSTVDVYRSYNEAVSVSQEDLTIESVDHENNFFIAKKTITTPEGSFWVKSKDQYTFKEGWGMMNVEILDMSPLLKQKFENAKNQDNSVWTSCSVKSDTSSTYESKLEDGTFQLVDGKTVKAQRDMYTYKGVIECIRMQHKEGDSQPTELERKEVGPGTVTNMSIYTAEVPSRDTGCEKIERLYYKNETQLDNGEVIQTNSSEIIGYH